MQYGLRRKYESVSVSAGMIGQDYRQDATFDSNISTCRFAHVYPSLGPWEPSSVLLRHEEPVFPYPVLNDAFYATAYRKSSAVYLAWVRYVFRILGVLLDQYQVSKKVKSLIQKRRILIRSVVGLVTGQLTKYKVRTFRYSLCTCTLSIYLRSPIQAHIPTPT